MSNAGRVDSDHANPNKPSPYEVMQAFDALPMGLRVRLCNAILDWDTKTVLVAYRDKKLSMAQIIAFLDEQEKKFQNQLV